MIPPLAETFSDFYEHASDSSAVYFARIVLDWEDQTDLPPLFNLFALPWHCFDALRRLVRKGVRSTGLVRPQLLAASTTMLARIARLPDSSTAFAARPYKLLADDLSIGSSGNGGSSADSDGSAGFLARRSSYVWSESYSEAPSLEEMKDAIAQTLQRRITSF